MYVDAFHDQFSDDLIIEKIHDILYDTISRCYELEELALISSDGLPIATVLREEGNDYKLAAMTSASLIVTEKIVDQMGTYGSLKQVVLNCEKGLIVIQKVSPSAILIGIASPVAWGLMTGFYMKSAVDRLQNIFE